ncbi:MAG TPA: TonB-dependent receptor, partial [Bacteroidales bacterium]|nr:TonB-dependent receptor [Bacteroidales bacterium]
YSRDLRYTGRYNSIKTNYWKITGYDETGKPVASNESNEAPRPNNGVEAIPYASSMSYFDASFLRLSNAAFGYTFKFKKYRKAPDNSLRFYFSVQNAFCITKYPGTDPESGSSYNVPNPVTVLTGVNFSL